MVVVLSAAQVHELLQPEDCLAAVREAHVALAAGRVHQPLRTVVRPPGATGFMALMPAYLDGARTPAGGTDPAFGVKTVTLYPDNPAQGKDAHQGAVLLFDTATGELLAVLNASAVTELRTAAVTALATDLLARPDSAQLTVFGAGVQARAHIRALARIRPFRRIRLVARDQARAEALAAGLTAELGLPVEVCRSAQEAMATADVIVTATTSSRPVIRREWLAQGTHINAIGACVPDSREIDSATMAAAALFADRRESLLAESGDYLLAAREGAIDPDRIRAELGEVLAGAAPGRRDEQELTLFVSVGLAAQDVAAAQLAHRLALARAVGGRADF